MGSALGLLLLFGWSLALIFHFFSGIRHLVWDAGVGFDAPAYNTSGWGRHHRDGGLHGVGSGSSALAVW